MSVSNYPEKIFLECRSEEDFPGDETYWDEIARNKTDVLYIRYDIVQGLRKTVADLYLERDIAVSRIATIQTELEMAKEALKPFMKPDGKDFKSTQKARRVRRTYRMLGTR